VSEDRSVNVEGHDYEASPQPGARTQHYYPGRMVAGVRCRRVVLRAVVRPALVAGAWGVGSYLVASSCSPGWPASVAVGTAATRRV
jgi:hypothetical protein